MFPDQIYYEPNALNYNLGKYLKKKYHNIPWQEISNHNNIEELRSNPNTEFMNMKNHIIIGTRKTHKYTPNQKVSDFLVPYTSSGCSAACLYCYLVCNYNKCSYLRLFVNREEMLEQLIRHTKKFDKEFIYEIGSNSDLVLENRITGNLIWTIKEFSKFQKGKLTFPTKFHTVDSLLPLDHQGRIIFRMSVNPPSVIKHIELGTSSLKMRIEALNKMCDAGYPVGLLIAPVIMAENWKADYEELIDILSDSLSNKVKQTGFIEVIFMTYSYVHRAINSDAFPEAPVLYDQELMTGRGMGKYTYKNDIRKDGELFLTNQLHLKLKSMEILYIS